MRVDELIRILKNMDQDAHVGLYAFNEATFTKAAPFYDLSVVKSVNHKPLIDIDRSEKRVLFEFEKRQD